MRKILLLSGILLVSSLSVQAQDCNPEVPDGIGELAAFSLFNTNYKNKDYEFALRYGRWMICKKPDSIEGYPSFNLERQWDKLINIYTQIGKSKEDPAVRASYLDSALTMMDNAMEMFATSDEKKFELTLDRGRFYQTNASEIEDANNKAVSEYRKLFDLDLEKATTLGDGYYAQFVILDLVNSGDKAAAQAFMGEVEPIADMATVQFIDEQRSKLIGSPEEVIEYYSPIVEENPDDLASWKLLVDAYEELDYRDELIAASRRVHELEPTFDSAIDLARIEKGNANNADAAKFYLEALEMAADDEARKTVNNNLAETYLTMEQLQTAKRYARAAINIDSNYGLAYITMARIYAAAVTQCTEERKLEAADRVVYWVVVDYLNRAKRVDQSVVNTVNSQISSYEAVAPGTEDKFFTLSLEDGQKIKVDGSLMACYDWINETTTVR